MFKLFQGLEMHGKDCECHPDIEERKINLLDPGAGSGHDQLVPKVYRVVHHILDCPRRSCCEKVGIAFQ